MGRAAGADRRLADIAVALRRPCLVGIGNTLVDVAGLTLLQRAAPPEVIARVFGVLEMMLVGTIGLGAILAPVLIDALGIRWSLVVDRSFLPGARGADLAAAAAIDAESHAPRRGRAAARRSRSSRPCREPTLERLAAELETVTVAAGTVVIRQGDHGDRFYVVAEARRWR